MISCFRLRALFMLLGMFSGPALAEWVPIDGKHQSPGLRTAYIDTVSIRREGNLATMSALIDWKWMQGNRSPSRFCSTKIAKQFDCVEKQVRSVAATGFYDDMGTGEAIGGSGHTSEGHWVFIEPGTINQGFGEAVCGKE